REQSNQDQGKNQCPDTRTGRRLHTNSSCERCVQIYDISAQQYRRPVVQDARDRKAKGTGVRSDQCSIPNAQCSSNAQTDRSSFPRMGIENWELSIGQIAQVVNSWVPADYNNGSSPIHRPLLSPQHLRPGATENSVE